MRFLLVSIMFCSLLALAQPAMAKTPYLTVEELTTEVRGDFEKILDLWRDGRYGELFERTMRSGRESKESFARRLADAPRRPACCWEKLQEVRVTLKNDTTAMVRAKVGLEGAGDTEFVTKSFKLSKDDGVWQLSQGDLLQLANAKKSKRRR